MANTVQQQFEQMAQEIMQTAQGRMAYHSAGKGRASVLKDMKEELLALKEAYEGLLSAPIMDTTFSEAMHLSIT